MNDLWEHPFLKEDYLNIRDVIDDTVKNSSLIIRGPLRNVILRRGKMVRPMLLVIASKFGNKQARKDIANIAAAVELLHLATLLHDDVIDDSPCRRGAPALHTEIGKKQAVLAGDYLFTQCFTLVAQYASTENSKILAKAVSRVCSSEIEQAEGAFNFHTGIRQYLRRITGKTAALFALSCFIGASEGGCSREIANIFGRIGYNLGISFQIIDDILDYKGNREELGKPIGTDLKEGTVTLPLIFAMQEDRGELEKLLGPPPFSSRQIHHIINHVVKCSGVLQAEQTAERYSQRALREIGRLPFSPPLPFLTGAVEWLLCRTN
jgi:heptaprenyl diphosphate synthase